MLDATFKARIQTELINKYKLSDEEALKAIEKELPKILAELMIEKRIKNAANK